jgi:hypothetical protein
MKNLFVVLFLIYGCIYLTCTSNIAGNSTQTGNPTVSAMLYNPGGSPAVNASVHFYKSSDDPRNDKGDSTETDSHGNYVIHLDTGIYNIIAHGDSGLAFQDSIKVIKGDTIRPHRDTLKAPGTIKGIVQLQPGDDARTVFILFMGTHTFTLPSDDTGHFTTDNMAAGKYSVRILTTTPNYKVLDTTLSVIAGIQNLLPNPLVMQYTGIPTPKNVRIVYDTLKQIVTLTWDSANASLVSSYNVYRRNVGLNTVLARINTSPVTGTSYRDSTGVQDSVYEYSVAAVNASASEGVKSAAVSVIKVSAYPLITTINLDSSGPGPIALAVAPDTTLYVAYHGNSDGFVGMYNKTGHLLRKVGAGMFTQVFDAAIDSRKNIYVADPDKGRIVKFNAAGDSIAAWSANIPTSLAIDALDMVYVVASNGQELIIFDTTGNQLDSLVAPASQFSRVKTSHVQQGIWVGDIASGNIKHYQPNFILADILTITQGPIGEPSGIRGVDDSDLCYVSEYQRPVYVFNAASTLKSWWSPGAYECLALSDKSVYVIIQNGLEWKILSYHQPQ